MKKRNRFTRGKFRTRKQPGTMNETEQAYSEVLNERQRTGAILEWTYEPLTFKLADNTRYTPDFVVQYPDGAMEVHEVKACKRTGGFLAEDDAMVKIKVAAEMYPWFRWFLCGKLPKCAGGDWKFREI